jgi:RecG-like helicase
MSDLLNNLFEKYKAKGGDEQNFMDKHTDNVQVTSAPGSNEVKPKNKKYDRKKDRKGYEPGEDEEVYETFALLNLEDLNNAIHEFCEESSQEDIDILEEILNNEEYTDELLKYIFEENEEDDEDDEDDDDEEEEDLDEAEFPTWEVKVRKPFGQVKTGQHVTVKARDVAEAIKKATYRWTNDTKVVWPSSHFEVKKRG